MAARVPRCLAALVLLAAAEGACPGADGTCAGGEEEAALLQQSSRQAIAQSSSCDTSGCTGCSGEQCQLCYDEKAKECCLDQFCRGCSGEQCTYCRNDHMAGCCAGKHPGTPGCSGPSPTPTPSPPSPTPNTLGCTATPAGTCGNPDILCYWEPSCANGGLCCKADGKTNQCKFCGVGSCGACP